MAALAGPRRGCAGSMGVAVGSAAIGMLADTAGCATAFTGSPRAQPATRSVPERITTVSFGVACMAFSRVSAG
ncbi:hypothetical protein Adi01nite_01240 [Amorphoplanes digitatis]|nr:hypothetical protein Adi01nite_01240 [Actinoplanes digitatis]